MASDTGRMSVSVDTDKQARLDAIASGLDRSRSWVVNQAIDQYLELYDWQRSHIERRLAYAESPDAVFRGCGEVDALIETYRPGDDRQ